MVGETDVRYSGIAGVNNGLLQERSIEPELPFLRSEEVRDRCHEGELSVHQLLAKSRVDNVCRYIFSLRRQPRRIIVRIELQFRNPREIDVDREAAAPRRRGFIL